MTTVGSVRGRDYYATGFRRNDLDLQGPVVFARYRPGRTSELRERYPDRAFYLYRYVRAEDRGQLVRLDRVGDEERRVPLRARRAPVRERRSR